MGSNVSTWYNAVFPCLFLIRRVHGTSASIQCPSNMSNMTISEDSMLIELHYIASPLFRRRYEVRVLPFRGEWVTAGERRMRTRSTLVGTRRGVRRYSLAKTLRCRDWSIITFENDPIDLQLSSKSKYERSGTNSLLPLYNSTPPLYPIDKCNRLLRAPLQI